MVQSILLKLNISKNNSGPLNLEAKKHLVLILNNAFLFKVHLS